MDAKEIKAIYDSKPWTQFYPKNCPKDVTFVYDKSITQLIEEPAQKWKDKAAIYFYGTKITYGQFMDYINRFATALADLGVKKGDRVGLYLLNSPAVPIAYFAILKLGATQVAISPQYVSVEIKHQMEDSGAETIICQDILYDHLEKAGVGSIKNVIMTNIADYLPALKKALGKSLLRSAYEGMEAPSSDIYKRKGFYRFQDLLKYPPNPPKVDYNPKEDVAVISYTGGTTGLPKGAMLTHTNLISGYISTNTFLQAVAGQDEVMVAYMPLYHIFGMVGLMLNSLLRGAAIDILTTPVLDDILNGLENHKATIFMGAPSIYETLRNYEKTDRVNWKRMKFLVSAADSLMEDTAKGWEKRTGTRLCEGWGATENPSGTYMPPDRIKQGSIGVPVPGVKMAVAHAEENRLIPPGEIGEIVVWSPAIMKGYWNHPEETKEVKVEIDGEPWFRSSDLGRMDEEGYFWFYERKRDRIKYKGYSVFAREIEEVLAKHPAIKDVAVIGVPDPKVGENIKAVVVLERDARGKVSEADIIKYTEENLAHYKVPKIVEFRGEIPKTDIGKVSRRELREMKD